MKYRNLLSFFTVSALLLLLIPLYGAHCQNYVGYKIQIHSDHSADWTITRISDINTDIDVLGFQVRVFTLVDAAANETHRAMTVDEESLQMSDEIYWETQTRKTIYAFKWQNFSIEENGKLIFGDVFNTANFFVQLYGDGALQIIYSATYSVSSVAPQPDERDDSAQTLKWLGTTHFINGTPEIVLVNKTQNGDLWQKSLLIGAIVAAAVASVAVGVYVVRRRKSKARVAAKVPLVESDEEKIVKIISASGGKMRQSAITEQCRFSKAKTSQLLAVLEQKEVITRYKRGRDKIVTLNERATGEN